MFLIKHGSPVQRITSDGYPFTDNTEGEAEVTPNNILIHSEAVLLTPEQNRGKWMFQMDTSMSWEVADADVHYRGKRLGT